MADSEQRGDGDARTLVAAGQILNGQGTRRGLARLLPFLGPAFIASIAYVDPGNFATNIAGGAKFGYTLLWVVVASNLMGTLPIALGLGAGLILSQFLTLYITPVIYIYLNQLQSGLSADLAGCRQATEP